MEEIAFSYGYRKSEGWKKKKQHKWNDVKSFAGRNRIAEKKSTTSKEKKNVDKPEEQVPTHKIQFYNIRNTLWWPLT